ncbi:type I restriction enzyme S subunit [Anaerosolibacter carboniphilus]|uniref:Type I restriction enzyme S subunit n=1 Tax=Anaerosolibacter carboniphilus TaxID=1417629 RepID=A0A841KXN0_9FIRM|nr:restriction endonuclease subunit S [Anaerosolibacter carboniphilus]MBB6218103.1 type I restriction enzyme S subunit [Anaerosolibacter carboniphilus]
MSAYVENFEIIFGVKNNIQALRNKVLELAIQGRLVEQDPNDEPAIELVRKIQVERANLEKKGKIKKQKPLSAIEEDEIPFEIPESWLWVRLGEIGQIFGGGTPKSDVTQYWEDGTIPWITPADLSNNKSKFISRGRRNITELGLKESSAILMPKGTVLFSSRAPIGHIAISNCEVSTNQGFKSIAPYIRDMNEYIYYFMKWDTPRINESASGTTFKEVSGAIVSEILLPIPPLAEQHRIVAKIEAFMSQIDKLEKSFEDKERLTRLLPNAVVDKIGSCQTSVELKEQLKFVVENFEMIFQTSESMQELRNVVLQLAIEGKLVHQDPSDKPAVELVKRIQVEREKLMKEDKIKKQKPFPPIEEDEIPFEIPDSWQWVRMGQVINFQGGYAYKSNSYIDNSDYQIIRLGNVKNDRILLDVNPVYIPADIALETMNYKISEGDILITMTGTRNKRDYFYTCRVSEEDVSYKQLYLNQRVGNLKPDKAINSYYISLMLKAKSVLNSIFATETGTANQGNIGSGSIENLIVPIPPANEQNRIVRKVESIMNLINQMEVELKRKVDLVEKMAN